MKENEMDALGVYNKGFSSWESVIEEFHGTVYGNDLDKRKVAELYPKPEIVLYAEYGGGSYDGDAVVVYFDKGKFYTVEGGHCSCYGLEDQWNPEEYDPETFLAALERKIEGARSEEMDYPSSSKVVWQIIKKRAEIIISGKPPPVNERK